MLLIVSLSCGGKTKWLDYAGQEIREECGEQGGRRLPKLILGGHSCKSLADSWAEHTQDNILHKANHNVTLLG